MTLTRHRLDLFSLLSGLFYTAIALVALTDSWTRPVADWVWPVALVATGLLVLGSALVGRGTRTTTATDATTDDLDPWDEDAVAEELRDDQSPTPTWAEDDPDSDA